MALFNNNDKQTSEHSKNTTIITAGTHFSGELTLECNLYVDGDFEGKIDSSNEVSVGQKGVIKGEISTKHLVVQGVVEGSIDATRVEIKEGGRVKGTIISDEFVIEAKGLFEGESKIKSQQSNDDTFDADTQESLATV